MCILSKFFRLFLFCLFASAVFAFTFSSSFSSTSSSSNSSYIPSRLSKVDYDTAVNNIAKATGVAVDDGAIYARPPSSSKSNKTPRKNNRNNVDDERKRIADAVRRHSNDNRKGSARRL